jgi:hypothetical protein
MIEHVLPDDWSDKLPFGSLTLRTLGNLCRETGCIAGGKYTILFPDGRLRIQKGFTFQRPYFLIVPERKMYVPCMVYSALAEFSTVLPFRSHIWNRIRKKLFLRMMMDRKVNFMTIGYIDWKL